MKYVYKMQDLECANCAAKMERAISKLPQVENVTVNFMTQKMTLEVAQAQEMESLLDEIQKLVSKVERHCKVVRK